MKKIRLVFLEVYKYNGFYISLDLDGFLKVVARHYEAEFKASSSKHEKATWEFVFNNDNSRAFIADLRRLCPYKFNVVEIDKNKKVEKE